MVAVMIIPFILLVLFDSMLCYQLYLALSCLVTAVFGLNRPRLPEWEEMVSEFHLAPVR